MTPLIGAIAVVLVAIISGVVTWLASRRTKSGKIDTSEAATLWDEGTNMRKELREEVTSLKTQLTAATAAMAEMTREIRLSRAETENAREETRQSRRETRELMEQIAELHGEVKTANSLTIGALADNTETRRILEIPKEDRTPMENEHVATAADRIAKGHLPIIPISDQEVPITDETVSDEDREAPHG